MKRAYSRCIILLLSMVLCSCGGSSGGGGEDQAGEGRHLVTYEVSTDVAEYAYITYSDADSQSIVLPSAAIHNGWSHSFHAEEGDTLHITARLLDDVTATLYVYIYVDGREVAQQRSWGNGVSASAEYDIPLSD